MADPQDALFKALNSNTQYQAAKSGKGGLLDMLLTGYQMAYPQAPAANMAMGMRQAYNVGQYNKAVQAEAAMQRQRQTSTDTNNAAIYNAATGQHVSGPFDTTLANSMAPHLRKDNAVPSMNDMLQGGALVMEKGADYDPALIRDYTKQQGEANNFLQKGGGLGDIASGQSASLIGQTLGKMGGTLGVPSLDPGQSRMLTGGVNKVAPNRGIDTNVSPWMYATDVPTNVAGLMKSGLDDAQAKGTLDANIRHDKATEQQAKWEEQNKLDHGYWSPNSPPAPHYPTFQEQMFGAMSPEQQKQFIARNASGTPDKPVKYPKMTPKDMETMQNLRKQYNSEAAGFFKNPGKAEVARQQYNMLAGQFGQSPIGTAAPATAFGGKGKSNLDSGKSKLSNSIYPGKG